jgi:hypothetical protein
MPDYNPYDELYGVLEASKPKPKQIDQDRLAKIARGNAYGYGLSTLVDAVGASMGANVNKRELPKTSLMAYNKYYQNEGDYDQRMDIYNRNLMALKSGDAKRKDDLARQAAAEGLARDKMQSDAEIQAARLGQAQANTQGNLKAKQDALAWDKKKFGMQQAADKAKEGKDSTKPFFGLLYPNQTGQFDTVPINEAQFYSIADIIRKNTTSAQALKDFDMLMNGFKMGDQTATQQLKLLITQRWSEFPEAMRIGLMGTPYVNDIVKDYSGQQFQPGMNAPQPGAGIPGMQPLNPQATQVVQPQKGSMPKEDLKRVINDIITDNLDNKGRRIFNSLMASGLISEEEAAKRTAAIKKQYKIQ